MELVDDGLLSPSQEVLLRLFVMDSRKVEPEEEVKKRRAMLEIDNDFEFAS